VDTIVTGAPPQNKVGWLDAHDDAAYLAIGLTAAREKAADLTPGGGSIGCASTALAKK